MLGIEFPRAYSLFKTSITTGAPHELVARRSACNEVFHLAEYEHGKTQVTLIFFNAPRNRALENRLLALTLKQFQSLHRFKHKQPCGAQKEKSRFSVVTSVTN